MRECAPLGTDRETGRQTDRETDIQTYIHTDRQENHYKKGRKYLESSNLLRERPHASLRVSKLIIQPLDYCTGWGCKGCRQTQTDTDSECPHASLRVFN